MSKLSLATPFQCNLSAMVGGLEFVVDKVCSMVVSSLWLVEVGGILLLRIRVALLRAMR